MACSRIRYPDDDFPIAIAIGALGVAGLLYLVVRRAAAAPAPPAANVRLPAPARATPAAATLPAPSNLSSMTTRADVQRRYQEVQEQATFDTRVFVGQEAMLVRLLADLNTIGDTRAANDTRAILEAVRRLQR